MTEQQDAGKIETYAIVEVFGHTKLAGFVRTVTLGTNVMFRVDVPEVTYQEREGYGSSAKTVERKIAPFTKFYSPASIFSLTPCTKEMAEAAMKSWQVQPIQYFDIKQAPALPAPGHDNRGEGRTGDDELDAEFDEHPAFDPGF